MFESQIGQDKWVCEFFKYKREGFFIDIGANDGKWLSNTYYLERVLDWTGICVEPGITPFNRLKVNRTCVCIQKLVADMNCSTEFYELDYKNSEPIKDGYMVEMIRLDKLMSGYDIPKVIDYVSIDTDGYDFRVLSSFPFHRHEVILWTLEHNGNRELKQSMQDVMNMHGYVIAVDNVENQEDWYINKKYASI
jgi:FkbM family methyltransferase